MDKHEALDWFLRRREMALYDKCQQAENVAITAIMDAIEREEPRVMTLAEVKSLPDETDVWLEEFFSIVVAATISQPMQRPAITEAVTKMIVASPNGVTYFYGIEHADYNDGKYMNADYGKKWRCWTSRPTDEQTEAVKWG
jgi:hypothetical protein